MTIHRNTRNALALGVLIVLATAAIVVALALNTAATREADYRACLAAYGLTDGSEGSSDGSTEPSSVVHIAEVAERCMSAVYGEEVQ